jgi:hypothetical protein
VHLGNYTYSGFKCLFCINFFLTPVQEPHISSARRADCFQNREQRTGQSAPTVVDLRLKLRVGVLTDVKNNRT